MSQKPETASNPPPNCDRRCRTFVLSDAPASEDYFGSHDRIANVISEMIREEKGGRSVALEGDWGSGKTTVINLLKSKLATKEECAVVTFDAWAHEGDPLRRTFIESLAQHLIQTRSIDGVKWSRRLDELAQRLEVKRTKTVPQITKWGKWVGLSLFLIPVGLTFLTAALREDVVIGFGPPHLKFWIELIVGLLFSFLPLLLILIALRTAAHGTGKSSEEKAAQIWSMFFSRTYTEERSETAKATNPTSIEFESTFVDLIGDALGEDPSRRLVVVLDNLDRIDPESALLVWSTLQTFLRHSHLTPLKWSDQLWVIVPYDLRAVRLPWDNSESNSEIRYALLEKSFQLRFVVSPPVLSRWHSFLIEQLSEAFPDHDSAEFHAVYQLLAFAEGLFPQPPTLRQLKLFVNQLGSWHRQWVDRFPLQYLAYYSLLTTKFPAEARANPVSLLTGHLSAASRSILGLDAEEDTGKLQDAFAALHFNTEIEVARQLLLEGPITDALVGDGSGDAANLAKLAEKYVGFWEVLESVIASDPWKDRGDLLGTAVATIAGSQILENSRSESAAVRHALCRLASRPRVDWLRNSHSPSLTGMCKLFEWKDDRAFTLRVLRQISSQFLSFQGDSRNVNIAGWGSALKEIARELRTTGQYELFADGVISPFVTSLEAPNTLEPPALVAVLSALCDLRISEPEVPDKIRKLALKNHIMHQLGSIPLNEAMEAARAIQDARKSNKPLPWESRENRITEAVVWCMYAHLAYRPHLIVQTENDRVRAGYEHMKKILAGSEGFFDFPTGFSRIILRYRELAFLNSLFDNEPGARPFILACIRRMDEDDYKSLISPELRAALTHKRLVPEW